MLSASPLNLHADFPHLVGAAKQLKRLDHKQRKLTGINILGRVEIRHVQQVCELTTQIWFAKPCTTRPEFNPKAMKHIHAPYADKPE